MNSSTVGASKSDDFEPQNSKTANSPSLRTKTQRVFSGFEVFEGIDIDQMYREHILDHYRNPRNHGHLDGLRFKDNNPLCGDEIEMFVQIRDGMVQDIAFEGKGCAISQASASMLTEQVKGRPVNEILDMNRERMQEMMGIHVSVQRVKCMMLPLKVLKTIMLMDAGGNHD